MWWYSHLPIIGLQIIAFFPYIIGSRRFYKKKEKFMLFFLAGIILDIIMALTPFLVELPRMSAEQSAPWSSYLFIFHITTAGIGMFGFIFMFIFLLVKGVKHEYIFLRKFQYYILLRLWIVGVGLALVNFFIKVVFNIRIYDYL